jgi:hypothetical protein
MTSIEDLRSMLPWLRVELRTLLALGRVDVLAPDRQWQYLHVTYEHPHVRRLWRPTTNTVGPVGRVMLHCLEPVPEGSEALWHPHPWPSSTLIVQGEYEMEIARSHSYEQWSEDDGDWVPTPGQSLASLTFAEGSGYRMDNSNAWHVVRPKVRTWSVMVTGERYEHPPAVPKVEHPGERLPTDDVRVQDYIREWLDVLGEVRVS